MALLILIVGIGAVCLAIAQFIALRRKIPKGLKPLPGPRGLPFIGNVHELPEELMFIKFHEWSETHGPIYQVNLAGHNHVWISRDGIARDILSKKSAIYSGRPHIPALIADNRDSGQYLPLMNDNDLWRRQRKFAGQIMQASKKEQFQHYPELEAIRMCYELIEDPVNYNRHLESFISRVTCRLAWGQVEASDELKQRARELLIGVSPTGALGNKLPFIMSLPDWLSPAKAWERRRAKTERRFFDILQNRVAAEMQEKRAPPSWMNMFLSDPNKNAFASHAEGAYAVGMHGIAGALTIAATLQTFCLAAVHNPWFVPMLQEEVDRVCGDRLPTNDDKPQLPFLRAVIRECFRWRPPVPTGIPHLCHEDDEYNGYFIPKGSIIHPLEWSISRDPAIFPDPETFNPLRWLQPQYPTYQEPLSRHPTIMNCTQFGYGLRTCQGQAVSEADLIVGIGSIAWLFDLRLEDSRLMPVRSLKTSISQEELITGLTGRLHSDTSSESDEDTMRRPIGAHSEQTNPRFRENATPRPEQSAKDDPTLRFTTLLIAKPRPFKFNMTPRDEKRVEHVRRLFQEKSADGEFTAAKEYWGADHGKGQEFGWVGVTPEGKQDL